MLGETMDILCLMGLFPLEYQNEIYEDSLCGVQFAANKLQWGLVNGLAELVETQVRICNSLYIGSYPKRYKKMRIPTFSFGDGKISGSVNVGFCNLSGYKIVSRYYSVRKVVDQWAKDCAGKPKVLLVYALTTPFSQIAGYVARKYKDVRVCVVVPDLPEYMNVSAMRKNFIYRFAKRFEIRWIRNSIKTVDHFVLLTESMQEWFEREIKYTIVEGIAQPTVVDLPAEKQKDVIYAGGVVREYGVLDLVEAFVNTDMPEWRLFIYGDGPDLEAVRSLSAGDCRVHVMGKVDNQTVVEHQRKASLLVNPRKNQEFTKYSFPSKILEYMASGTPMLAYKLDGVPDEYDEYYYCISAEVGIARSLRDAMCIPEDELRAFGKKAQSFVAEQKNPKAQCKKIVQLLR